VASVVVSVIAAIASVAAAGIAAWGAARASARADGIDRRRHMVEAHDERVASFRAAHERFMEVVAVVGHGATELERLGSLGPVLTRLEVLVTHPRASEEVTRAGEAVVTDLTDAFARGIEPDSAIQQHLNDLRAAVRAVFVAADAERARLLAELTAPAWWRRHR
jgi:hypothetical protein